MLSEANGVIDVDISRSWGGEMTDRDGEGDTERERRYIMGIKELCLFCRRDLNNKIQPFSG